jgi:hypothetical protein
VSSTSTPSTWRPTTASRGRPRTKRFAEDLVILRSHGVGARSTVVDLGAETGRFVATIAPHVGRVIGIDDPAAGYTAEEFAEHVRTEHSTFTWLLEPMLVCAGFDIVDRSVHRGAYAACTSLRRPPTP